MQTQMYIAGKWTPADSGRTLGVVNPATEDVVANVAYGGRAETRRAIDAAAKAMKDWSRRTPWERGKDLKKTPDLRRYPADSICRTMPREWCKPGPVAKS